MFKRLAIPIWMAVLLMPAGVFAHDHDDYREGRSYYADHGRDKHAEHEYREHEQHERREQERREREWREHERREHRDYGRYYNGYQSRPGYYDSYGYWHPRY